MSITSNPEVQEFDEGEVARQMRPVQKEDAKAMGVPPVPDAIVQLGFAYSASKTLLSAVELGLFTELAAQGSLDAATITTRLGLHERGARDFLDALVALRMLERAGGRYSNTPETDFYLDRAKPSYLGGILEMANSRLYGFWGSLTEALRTGKQQNEAKNNVDVFGTLYADPERLKSFLKAMSGTSLGAAVAIAQKFPWSDYKTFLDVGAAQGAVPVQVALAHEHLTGGGFDLPPVRPVFEEYVESHGLSDRLRFHSGDFFNDPLPQADVFIMGHILHDWGLEKKRWLIAKAYEALPAGGALIVYDMIIDDNRSENSLGLLMSLNMLIETPDGFDYTGADCVSWMRDAGFRAARVEKLAGPYSMVIGVK